MNSNDTYDCSKYLTTKEKLKETLEEYGVAIIPNVLNQDECNGMINDMWTYLEYITQNWKYPIKRNDEESWEEIYKLTNDSLLFQFWNIGHSQMSWNVRQNPKVVDIFSYFWNVKPEDLLVSFDGASIQLPHEIIVCNYLEKSGKMYHTDQSYINSSFKYLQSWITAFDVNKDDATLAFFESSHKYHKDFRNLLIEEPSKNDWYVLNDNELLFYKERCKEKHIVCPKGSLVLWDGRTIHCGIQASIKRTVPNIRCISYLCYAPRCFSNPTNLKLKQTAFNELRTTTHNPYKITFKPLTPYLDAFDNSKFISIINYPILSDLGKKLAGF